MDGPPFLSLFYDYNPLDRGCKAKCKNVKNYVNNLQKSKRAVGCFYYILAPCIIGSIEKTICPWKAVDIVLCAM
jgi:hypothetical protein